MAPGRPPAALDVGSVAAADLLPVSAEDVAPGMTVYVRMPDQKRDRAEDATAGFDYAFYPFSVRRSGRELVFVNLARKPVHPPGYGPMFHEPGERFPERCINTNEIHYFDDTLTEEPGIDGYGWCFNADPKEPLYVANAGADGLRLKPGYTDAQLRGFLEDAWGLPPSGVKTRSSVLLPGGRAVYRRVAVFGGV